jgi:hypothetical protein
MISEIIRQIDILKIKMDELWNERGKTDQEILGVSMEIDRLINRYYQIKNQRRFLT